MIGEKTVDFNPDGAICNPRGNPINYVWMGESEMPGDQYIGKEKKWCIQFHSGNLQSATIYFDEVDARKFKEKVNESCTWHGYSSPNHYIMGLGNILLIVMTPVENCILYCLDLI
jgi:hypothetical protein